MPVIATNTAANSAVNYLNENNKEVGKSVAKLSSGSRIVSASDDAAGLAISTKLSSDEALLRQSETNASQAASILQIADGGLARISDALSRMNSLAAQSQNGAITDKERAYVDAEYQQLLDEVTGIAESTRFNGSSLLDTSTGQFSQSVDFFVGTASTDVISFEASSLSTATSYTSAGLGFTAASSVSTQADAATAITEVAAAIDLVSEARSNLGAYISRFELRSENLATQLENTTAANSEIKDVDIAAEQTKLTTNSVLVQSAISALSQANAVPQQLLGALQ